MVVRQAVFCFLRPADDVIAREEIDRIAAEAAALAMVLETMKSVAEFSYQFHFLDRGEMEKTLCFQSVPRPRFDLLRKNPTENFLHL